MSQKFEPESSPEPNEVEGASELFEWVKKVKEVLNFWRTRQAILDNEPVYEYGKKKLEEHQYLGPLQFNFVQSTISGLPAFIVPVCARMFGISGIAEEGKDEAFNRTWEILGSFAVPFILMLTAYLVGRASIWKRDATKAAKRRAAAIFLYLDGAYGFYPQLAATVASSILTLPVDLASIGNLPTFLWLSFFWQLDVSMKAIPKELFSALGYTEFVPTGSLVDLLRGDLSSEDRSPTPVVSKGNPPKWKYRTCVLLVIPILVVTVWFVTFLLSLALSPVVRFFSG
jgi:hypothetical protein